jgi:hypothetical protein
MPIATRGQGARHPISRRAVRSWRPRRGDRFPFAFPSAGPDNGLSAAGLQAPGAGVEAPPVPCRQKAHASGERLKGCSVIDWITGQL